MKRHLAKLRMKTQKYAFWKALGSQPVQEVLERQEKAYERFFNKQDGLPHFRKVKKFRSFTLKQVGWKLLDSPKRYGQVRVGKRVYNICAAPSPVGPYEDNPTMKGNSIDLPLFYRDDLSRLRTIQRQVSKKVKGRANRQKGKHPIARRHIRIDDKRRDFHFKLAHELCDPYDSLCFEDLNLDGTNLWLDETLVEAQSE